MENNQKNQGSQQDTKATAPTDGNKKETNPNNPTATQNQEKDKEQRKDSTTPAGKTNSTSSQSEKKETEEETIDETHGAAKTIVTESPITASTTSTTGTQKVSV